MMLAMFVTNFEKLAGLQEDTNVYHQDVGDGMDDPYPYAKNKEDYTQHLANALKQTLRQVHYIVLEHEYKSGVQPRPADQEHQEMDTDGASSSDPLPPTRAIGRLNLAVTDGQSTCTTRYVSSNPDTAHSLYYSSGSKLEITNHNPQVLNTSNGMITPPVSPMLLSKPKKERVVVVSSEPLAVGFNCKEVPVNHMVVSGPNAHFSLQLCV